MRSSRGQVPPPSVLARKGIASGRDGGTWEKSLERASEGHEGSGSSTTLTEGLLSHKQQGFSRLICCKHGHRVSQGGMDGIRTTRGVSTAPSVRVLDPKRHYHVTSSGEAWLEGFEPQLLMCNKPPTRGRPCGLLGYSPFDDSSHLSIA